jgi:hypothetical protein
MIWRRLHQQKRVKPKHKVKLENLGFATREELNVPMEEVRRQGMLLAGQPFGQGVRPVVKNQSVARSTKPARTVRRGRRGPKQ